MKVECAGCKKIIAEEDFDQCHIIYKCRRDHVFACCKVECQRVFEKRCHKTAEIVHKTQHKLNNDGHTSALRRLPPGERDKFKQHAEAEQHGWLICPEEIKAIDRSVPFCSFVVERTGGTAPKESESSVQEAPPPPPPKKAVAAEVVSKELVSDDMLVAISKDEDEEEMIGKTKTDMKKVKGAKGKKDNKKGEKLTIDWRISSGAPVDEAPALERTSTASSAPWSGKANPGGLGAAQVWSKGGGVDMFPAQVSTPTAAEQAKRRKALMDTTGCTEGRANEVLSACGWDLERAADALFRTPAPRVGYSTAAAAPQASTKVPAAVAAKVAPVAAAASPAPAQATKAAEQPTPKAASTKASNMEEAATRVVQRAQAAEREREQRAARERAAKAERERAQELQTSRLETATRPVEVLQRQDPEVKQPPPVSPPPPPVPSGWKAVFDENQQAYYYWKLGTNEVTWEQPAMPSTPTSGSQTQRSNDSGVANHAAEVSPVVVAEAVLEKHEPKQISPAQQVTASIKAAEERQIGRSQIGPGEYLCAQHWRPREDLKVCLRLLQGERLSVTWTDGEEEGWAYGTSLEDSSVEGYFPQGVLKQAPCRPLKRLSGEVCNIKDTFGAPKEVQGYLSVDRGDTIKVLHPSADPYVWVYVEHEGPYRGGEVGWVPESILLPLSEDSIAGPNPAG